MNVTPTLNLHKPDINGEDTENVWGYDLNTNFDLIDAAFAGLAGDKGDVIVGANGSLTFDPNIVTAAARSVIAGPTITAMRTTLGAEAAIPGGTTAQFWRGDKSWQTLGIADIPALQPALNLKAPLADPVFTGNPTAPTPAPGDNDTSLATTAFVTAAMVAVGNIVPNNALPRMDGVAAPGTSPLYMRADHIHPSDTSRVAKTGDVMSGPLSGITTLNTTGSVAFGGAATINVDPSGSGLALVGRASDNLSLLSFRNNANTVSLGTINVDTNAGGRLLFPTADGPWRMAIDSTSFSLNSLPIVGVTTLNMSGYVHAASISLTNGISGLSFGANPPGTTGDPCFQWNGSSFQWSNYGSGPVMTLNPTTGALTCGGTVFAGDLSTSRASAPETGVVFFGNTGKYIIYDGAVFHTTADWFVQQNGTGPANGVRFANPTSYIGGLLLGSDNNIFVTFQSGSIATINSATGAYSALSDGNSKKAVASLDTQWEAVKALNPISYLMKEQDDDVRRNLGFVAQEVREVIPQAWSKMPKEMGDLEGLEMTAFIPVLTKALQEVMTRLEVAEARVAQLEAA